MKNSEEANELSISVFQELMQQPAQLESFLQDFPGVIYRISAINGKVIFVNESIKEYTGFDRNEVLNPAFNTSLLIESKELQDVLKEVRTSIDNKKTFDLKFHLKHKNGNKLYVRSIGSVSFDQFDAPQCCVGTILDITEMVNSEIVLKEKSSLIQSILDTSPSAIFVKDLNGRFTAANEAMSYHFDKTPEEVLGKNDEEIMGKHTELNRFNAEDLKVLNKGEIVVTKEKEFVNTHGERVWFNTVKSPIRNYRGEVIGLLGVVTDVSEEVRVRKEIREHEELLDSIYNNVTDLIALLKPEGDNFTYVSCNASFLNAFKMYDPTISEEMLQGKDFEEMGIQCGFFTEETAAFAKQKVKSVLDSKESITYYEDAVNEFGKFYFKTSIIPFFDANNEVQYLIYQGTDLTDVMRANDQLRERENLLESINHNLKDGIYRSTLQEGLLYANSAMLEMFGYSFDELKGAKVKQLYVDPESRNLIITELKEKGIVSNREVRLRKKNGEEFWGRISCTLSEGDKDEKVIDGIIADVTERRKIKKQLEETNNSLLKSNSELDHLVYRTSHDLRSPIASLLGLTELISIEGLNDTQNEYSTLMRDQLQKLDKIILDIINYRKVAKAGLQKQEINFQAIIDDIISSIKFLENFEKINLKINIDSEHSFSSDPHSIQMILNNFISNAVKYARKDIPDPKIAVNVSVSNNKVQIEIEDNGIGIPKDQIDQIFKMFYRATDQNTGTGLGLYIVNEAVSKLNGEVMVESEPNQFTRFSVELPAMD